MHLTKIDVLLIAFVLISVVACTSLFYSSGSPLLATAIATGFISSLIYIVIGFASIYNAFDKTSIVFYRMFLGGLAVRFLLFIITLIYIYKCTSIPIIAFVISFILSYIFFQTVEIRLVWQKLEKQKSDQ